MTGKATSGGPRRRTAPVEAPPAVDVVGTIDLGPPDADGSFEIRLAVEHFTVKG